jgi:carbohydrate diacid regulator
MNSSPLNSGTAAAFVKRLGEHLDYNINIMDRDGVIIASKDPSRIGTFHDAAQRIVATGAAEERVEASPFLPAGVKPGVNLPIVFKGEILGVVGVTGDPCEVASIAYAVKTSVESMIELEVWKDRAIRRQDRKNLLFNSLLYDDVAGPAAVEALARNLGYTPDLPRCPLLLVPPPGAEASDVLKAVKANPLHGKEDLSWSTPEGAILVFKTIRFDGSGIIEEAESQVSEYVAAARKRCSALCPLKAYAGGFQTDLGRYRPAFHQTLWLAEQFPEARDEVVFLYEHLLEYFASRIPRAELVTALDPLARLLPQDAAWNLRSSTEALVDSALNGKEAAARLGVHRNTFSARMEKLSHLLGRDPRRDPRALDLLSLLARYLEMQK